MRKKISIETGSLKDFKFWRRPLNEVSICFCLHNIECGVRKINISSLRVSPERFEAFRRFQYNWTEAHLMRSKWMYRGLVGNEIIFSLRYELNFYVLTNHSHGDVGIWKLCNGYTIRYKFWIQGLDKKNVNFAMNFTYMTELLVVHTK